VISVPGLSAPGKLALLGLDAVTFMVQSLADAVPPPSLTTCLMTVSEASLSMMLTVATFGVPTSTDPESVPVNVIITVSVPSTSVSSNTSTVMIALGVADAGTTTVPDKVV